MHISCVMILPCNNVQMLTEAVKESTTSTSIESISVSITSISLSVTSISTATKTELTTLVSSLETSITSIEENISSLDFILFVTKGERATEIQILGKVDDYFPKYKTLSRRKLDSDNGNRVNVPFEPDENGHGQFCSSNLGHDNDGDDTEHNRGNCY